MKLYKTAIKALIASTFLAGSFASATELNLPSANELSTGTPYHSFSVYSLDLLEKCAADLRCQPQAGLPVQSGPGQIRDQAVVLTSANGISNFPDPFPVGSAVDNRFLTPTGITPTYTMTGADGGGTFTGDQVDRWDIRLDLLQTYLGSNELVFLFDNNQQGNGTSQFIFLWGQARIVRADGTTVDNLCFELSNNSSGCTDAGANPTPANSEYVAGATDFCVDKITGASYNIGTATMAADCPVEAGHPQGGYQVNNNISTANAEFAAFNQSLNDAAKSAANSGYFLSLNIKYFGNNAGAEQLFLCSQCNIGGPDIITDVPEPATLPLVLLGLGFAGLAAVRRRK
jgi:hypothetical protein